MPTEINGLPAHVLLIHAIVILAPLAALMTILSAVWPVARRKIGIISPITALIVLVLTPITINAGEWLQDKLTKSGPNKAIQDHADLGESFWVFAIGLFVVSAAVWWIGRLTDEAAATATPDSTGGSTATMTRTRTAVPVAVQYAVQAVAVIVSIVVVVQLYRIGDSGASATWDFVDKIK